MERRETVINEHAYSMLVPAVRQAMPLCTRVATLLGPILGTLGKEVESAAELQALATGLQNVEAEKVDILLMNAVGASHLCDASGKPISDPVLFEQYFTQCRGDVYQVCVWVLWECVQDFFPTLGAFARQTLGKVAEAASPSQQDGQ